MLWACYYYALRRSRPEAAGAVQPAPARTGAGSRCRSRLCACLPRLPGNPALRWLQREIACSIEVSGRSATAGKGMAPVGRAHVLTSADVPS